MASTSSASVRTTDGTSADLDTRYAFCSTRRSEHEGEQGQGLDEARQEQAQHDPGESDDLDHRPPSAGGAVDDRADDRGDEHERGEADDEEQQHARTRRIEIDGEEQRVGEGDDHRRVPTHHRRVGDAQATELGDRSRHDVAC